MLKKKKKIVLKGVKYVLTKCSLFNFAQFFFLLWKHSTSINRVTPTKLLMLIKIMYITVLLSLTAICQLSIPKNKLIRWNKICCKNIPFVTVTVV